MIGVHDLRVIGIGQLAVDAVDERADFAGVDEERFAFAVRRVKPDEPRSRLAVLFFARNQRQTGICVL